MAVRTNQTDPAVAVVVMLLWWGDDGSHGGNGSAVRRGGGAAMVGRPRWWWVVARDGEWVVDLIDRETGSIFGVRRKSFLAAAVVAGGGRLTVLRGGRLWWWFRWCVDAAVVAARDGEWGGGSYRPGDGECFWGSPKRSSEKFSGGGGCGRRGDEGGGVYGGSGGGCGGDVDMVTMVSGGVAMRGGEWHSGSSRSGDEEYFWVRWKSFSAAAGGGRRQQVARKNRVVE
nr:hypothetical protein [Tanacetum cinerariifolium]